MTDGERVALIEQYRRGYDEVVDALAGCTDAQLDARPAPGKWSSREIVHHLADSEMTSAIRLRRLIAEEQPVIHGYDQDEFARRLFYDRPIGMSLAAFRAARASTVEILERLTPEQWARTGTHTESGAYSVGQWLEIYGVHAHNHADQIRRAVGKQAR
jgi:DinB superfamily